LYGWHISDPIRFEKKLRVTIQDLGWRNDGRYLPLQDDMASTVLWDQTELHGVFPKLPGRMRWRLINENAKAILQKKQDFFAAFRMKVYFSGRIRPIQSQPNI